MASTVVRADRSRAVVALLRWSVGATALGLVVGIGRAFDGGAAGLLAPLLFAVAGLVPGSVHAAWWAMGPGRVSYAVEGDWFFCRRGGRVVRRWPCTEVVAISMEDPLTWSGALLGHWFGYLDVVPDSWVIIDTGDRWSPRNGQHHLPSILLWGKDRLHRAENDLQAALEESAQQAHAQETLEK